MIARRPTDVWSHSPKFVVKISHIKSEEWSSNDDEGSWKERQKLAAVTRCKSSYSTHQLCKLYWKPGAWSIVYLSFCKLHATRLCIRGQNTVPAWAHVVLLRLVLGQERTSFVRRYIYTFPSEAIHSPHWQGKVRGRGDTAAEASAISN